MQSNRFTINRLLIISIINSAQPTLKNSWGAEVSMEIPYLCNLAKLTHIKSYLHGMRPENSLILCKIKYFPMDFYWFLRFIIKTNQCGG